MKSPEYKSTEYQFKDQRLYEDYYSLNSIGWEYWSIPEKYYHDCRSSADKICVFQYTVSGEGVLVCDKKAHSIKPGQAFIIEKPGQYQYYCNPEVGHWEVQYISFHISALKIWHDIKSRFGRILDIPKDSQVIQCWHQIYQMALNNELNTFYTASGYAYQFMMQLYNTLIKETSMKNPADMIQRCVLIIQSEYSHEIDLAYLAGKCDASVSYLSKRFREVMGVSPIQYLNQYRIKIACALLFRGNYQVNEVAREVGFTDPNYFTRAFKKAVGLSPKEYQRAEMARIVEDHTLQLQVSPNQAKKALD